MDKPAKIKNNCNLKFFNCGGDQVGVLDFNGPAMTFTGNAEESAKVFFDWIASIFYTRLAEEREECKRKILLDLWDALPDHEATGDTASSLRAMLMLSEIGDELRKRSNQN